jgi:lipoprotein-anchoring transpeptidase ErfK/SrfK
VRRRRIWSRWPGAVLVALIAAALCVGVGAAIRNATRSSAAPKDAAAVHPRVSDAVRVANAKTQLTQGAMVTPARAATNVPLDSPIVVASKNGWVRDVHVVASGGPAVSGALAPNLQSWWSQGFLAPNTTYQITAHLANANGVLATVTSSFTTLTPGGAVTATVFPQNGLTVGVGQPIVLKFDHPITDPDARQKIVQHLTVWATHQVPGGWHWFSPVELHFRPQSFWAAHENVTVAANLDGWNAGGGLWGSGNTVVHFATGDSHVAIANLASHTMSVTVNGHVVANYPFSGGRDKYPTMNGTHLVMDRQRVVHMVSSTNGIPVNSPDGYDELVYWDVHISDSGEYVHAAPWSVGSQGRSNVSHGCINVSDANAEAFYNFSGVGDIVLVTGGPRPPELGDHGVMDWDTPFNQWMPSVAHWITPPAAKAAPNPMTNSH